ncbi:MAG TPA: TetR family transcriptional regulator [Rhizomicrobium sp.]|nr:TetR family transcriptional regulator [Rhizomicrobium sp.]
MQTKAEGATGAGSTARIWQRGATRRAILDAARAVIARTDSTDFSLNTVAKEAGYSATTVFAYFSNKDDLFNCIVADDLASLAHQMRETYFFSETPSAEVAEPENPVAETPALEETPVVEAPAVESASVAAALVAEAETPAVKEPPRVDAWLERRLRVFEKTLADIEERLAGVQKDAKAAALQVEENTRIFGARLDSTEKRLADFSSDLSTRMAGAEKRVRDAQSDVRTSLQNISMRLDQLEAVAARIAGQTEYTPPEIVPVPQEPAPEESAAETADDKPLTAAADTYLSAARRAAKTAAALAEIEQEEAKFKLPPWMKRTNVMIAGAVAMMFVVGPMAAYAVGEKVGRSTPVRVVVPRAIAQQRKPAPVKTAALTPLDRLSELAAAGNPRAELLIGLRYLNGDGAVVNKAEAAKWILKSANAHDPMGQYWAGEIYRHGDGTTADAAQAVHWYEAAAGQGNRQAMHDLGVAFAEGDGAAKDYVQSAIWFAKAASLGLVNSQFNLAVLYERGEGVKESLADAYKWYAIAAAQGDSESKARVDAIATQLKPAILDAARSAAAAFKPQQLDADANTTALPGA